MFSAMLWWQLMALILVCVGCVAFLIAFITKRGISVKAKGVEIGKDAVQSKSGNAAKGVIDTPRWKDILLVVEWSTIATREISRMEEIKLIKDQMHVAEAKLMEMRDLFRRSYLKLLAETKGVKIGLLQMHESHDYENILKILTTELRDEFRTIFRENHLFDRSDIDFEKYIKSKKEHMDHKITEILNDIYPPDISPSREEVYDVNQRTIGSTMDIIEDVIREGKYISCEYRRKTKAILAELDGKINKIIGPMA